MFSWPVDLNIGLGAGAGSPELYMHGSRNSLLLCVCYNIGSTIDHGVGNIGYNIGCFFVASGF